MKKQKETNEALQLKTSRKQKKFELLRLKREAAGTLKPVKERKESKKKSSQSIKRLNFTIYDSLPSFLTRKETRHHINPIDKDEVKLTAEIKKEAKVKLAKVKEMRKLRDAELIKASEINKLAKAERHAKITAQKTELRTESKKVTNAKKELKVIARTDAKKLYLEKKALDRKVIKHIRAKVKSTKLAA